MFYLMTSDSVGGKSERLTHFVKNHDIKIRRAM